MHLCLNGKILHTYTSEDVFQKHPDSLLGGNSDEYIEKYPDSCLDKTVVSTFCFLFPNPIFELKRNSDMCTGNEFYNALSRFLVSMTGEQGEILGHIVAHEDLAN